MTNNSKSDEWKEIKINARKQRTRYGISSSGRVCSFREKITECKVLKGTMVNGYPALKIKVGTTDHQFYIHKLVAEYFVQKGGKNKTFVIHQDYNKLNNKAKNLRWATKEEMEKHQQGSPGVKSYRERTRAKGHKLTAAKVRQIKQMITAKDRRRLMKDIAAHFGISEMQLYRIKSGENWGHVK